jgi:hypothetical protein
LLFAPLQTLHLQSQLSPFSNLYSLPCCTILSP